MEQNNNEDGPAPVSGDCREETLGIVALNAHLEGLRHTASKATAEPPLSVKLHQVADRSFDFLSNASNETLGACVVGLGICTYFILGRVGLVVIGVVCGAFLHSTWENNGRTVRHEDTNAAELKRRRQLGVDAVSQLLEWRQTSAIAVESDHEAGTRNAIGMPADRDLDFESFQPVTRAALTGLIDAVVRDYVKYSLSALEMCFH